MNPSAISGFKRSASKRNGYNAKIVVAYWAECGIPEPVPEYKFHPERRWEIDFAWPAGRLGLEADGGIWIGGRHNRGAQIKKTWEKENEANAMGWHFLKCEPRELCTTETVNLIKRCLKL